MDILSLPDEMLASIFKYSKFETIRRSRKINQKIDRAMVNYGLNKPKITGFILNTHLGKIEICYEDDDLLEIVPEKTVIIIPNVRVTLNINNSDPLETLEKYLNKARLVDEICLNKTVIDERWLNMLNECKHYKTASICLWYCALNVPIEELATVLGKYKPCRIEVNETTKTLEGTYVNDKVLTCLLPNARALIITRSTKNTTSCPEISDETLRAARNSKIESFELYRLNCSFTIQEVIETAEELIHQRVNGNFHISWNFGCIKMNSKEEIQNLLDKMSIYSYVRVLEYEEYIHKASISYFNGIGGFAIDLELSEDLL